MKKLFAMLLVAGCGVSFVGCTEKPAPKPEAPKPEMSTPADPAGPESSAPIADPNAAPPAPDAAPAEGPAPEGTPEAPKE